MQDSSSHAVSSGESVPAAILPGATIGLLGGGQLGRMFAIAAKRMGYFVHVFDPQPHGPASQVCDMEVNAPFDDAEALARFASAVDVVTFEFENIPVAAIDRVAEVCPVRPRGQVLHICQNREREKLFLQANGFPCAPFRVVDSEASLIAAVQEIGTPAVLKTADFGYDGKGQIKLKGGEDLAEVWKTFNAPRGVLEGWVNFEAELSVVVARGVDGSVAAFPVSENIHRNHILDLSIVPARFGESICAEAAVLAEQITRTLDVVGLLAVEFFLSEKDGLIVNELAPRPHNSGHYSFDACVTSQFEQHVRAVCGLPLGSTELLSPVVMWNILGDAWEAGTPDWKTWLANPAAKLHLYGKAEPRVGRKMGHLCVLADSTARALQAVEAIRQEAFPESSR